jgi:xanthine dehydrogenase YagS FAD-binding subunit
MIQRIADSNEAQRASKLLSSYLDGRKQEFYQARSLDEAVGLLNEYGKEAKVVAGGVDILGLIKSRVFFPQVLISLKQIPGLRFIQENENGITIGPMTSINDMERSPLIKNRYPALFETACSIASPQVRNMGTVGGNLCQEVRCWYYRRSPDTGISFECWRKTRGGHCFAKEGENQYHAIIGANDCCAVCPSDLATTLLALNGRIETKSAMGQRSLAIDEIFSAGGSNLGTGEIISGIRIPDIGAGSRQSFIKFRTRKAIDFAILSAASCIKLEDGIVQDARIVVGGASYKPHRLLKAEQLLKGERLGEKLAAQAAKEVDNEAAALSKNSYKIAIAKALVKKVIPVSQD